MAWSDDRGFGDGPPDPAKILAEIKSRFGGKVPGGVIGGVVVLALLAWAATGFYIVNPSLPKRLRHPSRNPP